MGEISYLSKEGMENLKIEIQELKTNGRKEMSQQINEAREKGDLAENAEYHAAKEAQGLMEMKLHDTKFNKDITYKLVSEKEADIKTGKISVTSPIGKGLLGKSVGDTVKIIVPAGSIEFKILDISVV